MRLRFTFAAPSATHEKQSLKKVWIDNSQNKSKIKTIPYESITCQNTDAAFFCPITLDAWLCAGM